MTDRTHALARLLTGITASPLADLTPRPNTCAQVLSLEQRRLRRALGEGIPVEKLDMLTSVGAGLGPIASQPDGGASWGD